MVGFAKCHDCKKWKAHKAFVRSRVRRDSELWVENGYMWHKYKSCNRCFRTYRNRGMSVDEFVRVFGAEEHDQSEPEILIGEVEAEGIKDIQDIQDTKDIKDAKDVKEVKEIEDKPGKDAKDNNIQVDGAALEGDDAKLPEEDINTQDKAAEDAEAKRFRLERLLLWRVDQPERPKILGQPVRWIDQEFGASLIREWRLAHQPGGNDEGANAP